MIRIVLNHVSSLKLGTLRPVRHHAFITPEAKQISSKATHSWNGIAIHQKPTYPFRSVHVDSCHAPSTRVFSTNVDEESWEQPLELDNQISNSSNRSLFKALPVNPSILEHIRSIGVGIRPRTKRKKLSKQKFRDGGLLSEADEREFFSGKGGERRSRSKAKKGGKDNDNEVKVSIAMPPPPFSCQVVSDVDDVTEKGHRIKRLPVKVLGSVGSVEDEMPRSSKGLPEVAIVGRSNVGKSTLLNVSRIRSDVACITNFDFALYRACSLYISQSS